MNSIPKLIINLLTDMAPMLNRTGIIALILGMSLVSSALSAQDVDTEADTLTRTFNPEQAIHFNLEQAIQTALANNTDMKRALLTIRDADQDIRSAWGNVMPQVAASANYTRNLEVPVNFIPETALDPEGDPDALVPLAFGTDNNWTGGLSVSQTIFSGLAFVGISSSELYKTAQSEGLRATSQGVVTQTRIAYYQALSAKEEFRLIQAQTERIRENLEDTRQRAEQGFVDDYAVLQLEVQLGNLEPQLTSTQFSIENSLRELLDIMGLPVQLSVDIQGDLGSYDVNNPGLVNQANESIKKVDQLTPHQIEKDSIFTEKAMNMRGDIRVLDVQEELRGKQLDAERSLSLPSVTANYDLQWNASQGGRPRFFGNEQQRARSQTLMLGVQIPIFQGFQRNAAVQKARIQIKDVELQQFQARQTAGKEILSSAQGVREALATSEALAKVLEQAETGYERALTRYQNGVGTQEEVNDANLQLREAEINYARMVSNYLTAKARYDQAIGQVPFVEQDIRDIQEQIELK